MGNYKLYHHGVKGQKWGVRNGPPYPIEDKVLRKGTRLNSVSTRYSSATDYKNNGRWMYTYNPDDKWDSKVYRGPFVKYKVVYMGARFASDHQYEVVKDLKMPTKKERIDEFIDMYTNNKRMVINDLVQVQKLLKEANMSITKGNKDVNVHKLITDADREAAYEIFNHAMENAEMFKSTKKYSEIMSKKYDAMVDDNNQGIYNNAHDPVIIFRANEALKELNSRYLTSEEVIDNYNKVRDELEKEGKRVKL